MTTTNQLEPKLDFYQPKDPIHYGKGENRRKHNGKSLQAAIVSEYGNRVGKCPRGFSLETAQKRLGFSFAEYRSRQPDNPFRLWTWHQGAVYAARTDDGGTTWHALPAQDPPLSIQRKLEELATSYGEKPELKRWLKKKWD